MLTWWLVWCRLHTHGPAIWCRAPRGRTSGSTRVRVADVHTAAPYSLPAMAHTPCSCVALGHCGTALSCKPESDTGVNDVHCVSRGWTMFLERKTIGRIEGKAAFYFGASQGATALADAVSNPSVACAARCLAHQTWQHSSDIGSDAHGGVWHLPLWSKHAEKWPWHAGEDYRR
jgi:hypothetical protein